MVNGDIVCALDELLLIAAERWRIPFSRSWLRRVSGLSLTTINGLMPDSASGRPSQERVSHRTIATLCSVFVCNPGELLRYHPRGATLARLSVGAVRRAEPPSAPVYVYPLTNHIPERLAAATPTGLEQATGVPESTWRRVKAGTTLIKLDTLAAICAFLQTDIDRLFTHVIPYRAAAWTVQFVRFDDHHVLFDLSHGVTVSAYTARWKVLAQADRFARASWQRTSDGQGVRWDALDLEVYPRALLD